MINGTEMPGRGGMLAQFRRGRRDRVGEHRAWTVRRYGAAGDPQVGDDRLTGDHARLRGGEEETSTAAMSPVADVGRL